MGWCEVRLCTIRESVLVWYTAESYFHLLCACSHIGNIINSHSIKQSYSYYNILESTILV